MKIKNLKREARKRLKRNYWSSVFICLLSIFLVGTSSLTIRVIETRNLQVVSPFFDLTHNNSSNSAIITTIYHTITSEDLSVDLNETFHVTRGVFDVIFDVLTDASNTFLRLMKGITGLFTDSVGDSVLLLIGVLLVFCYRVFFASVLEVGIARFFMESRLYSKTSFLRSFFPFKRKRYFSIVKGMFRRELYLFFWSFTIIGGVIKYYSYRFVPYLLAEGKNISSKEAILLSRQMMHGKKWKAFLLDLSFLPWNILDVCTFGLVGILFGNPYKSVTDAEFYASVRKVVSRKEKEYFDVALTKVSVLEPIFKFWNRFRTNYFRDGVFYHHYDLRTLILFFFTFSFIGWLWEGALFIINHGVFVNRGVLQGPWLPIYGTGCVVVLLLLFSKRIKPYLKNPMLTFVIIMVICATIEYSTGWFLETFQHAKWWDYSGYFLNLHGRICLEGTLFFGLGGSLCIYVVAPFLYRVYQKISKPVQTVLCLTLTVIFVIDFIYSCQHPNQGVGITETYEPIVEEETN